MSFQEYLKNNDVSVPLRERILKYSLNLWKGQKGYQVPMFLQEAPRPLQEEIKVAAYGKHLYEVGTLYEKFGQVELYWVCM